MRVCWWGESRGDGWGRGGLWGPVAVLFLIDGGFLFGHGSVFELGGETCKGAVGVRGRGLGASRSGRLERGRERGLRGQLGEDGGELGRGYKAGVGEVFQFLRTESASDSLDKGGSCKVERFLAGEEDDAYGADGAEGPVGHGSGVFVHGGRLDG